MRLFLFWSIMLSLLAQTRAVWTSTDSELNHTFGWVYAVIHIFRCDRNIDNINRFLFYLARWASHSCSAPKVRHRYMSGSIRHTWTWETLFSFFIQCLEVVSMCMQLNQLCICTFFENELDMKSESMTWWRSQLDIRRLLMTEDRF